MGLPVLPGKACLSLLLPIGGAPLGPDTLIDTSVNNRFTWTNLTIILKPLAHV